MTSASEFQICATCPHRALPVNSQVLPALRRVPSPPVVVRVGLPGPAPHPPKPLRRLRLASTDTPSVGVFFFCPCEDLLQAKTIKANGLRTFEGTANFKRVSGTCTPIECLMVGRKLARVAPGFGSSLIFRDHPPPPSSPRLSVNLKQLCRRLQRCFEIAPTCGF